MGTLRAEPFNPSELRSPPSENRRVGVLLPAYRLQRVALVLARHGFGELMSLELPPRERLAQRLARVLADLGPTYVKLGQLLATREDLMPPDVTRALGSLHADVPPMKPRLVLRTVEKALERSLSSVFLFFDPTPLAAASIGQVHRARLRSGEDVVVKVQRPGLARMVAADVAILRTVASMLSRRYPEIAALDPEGLIDAFERSLAAELDFQKEAANAERLAALLDGAPEVRVPKVYGRWTRRQVLVLEHVRGRRISELPAAQREAARNRLLRAFIRQILDHGVFHADPHPGNLLVEEDGRLVLLDLGAVDALERDLRRRLSRLVRALVIGRPRMLANAVLALSPGQVSDRPRFEREVVEVARSATGGDPGAVVLTRMIALGRTYRLRMPPALVALVRALALLDGLLRTLAPRRELRGDLLRELLLSMGRRSLRWLRSRFGWMTWLFRINLLRIFRRESSP